MFRLHKTLAALALLLIAGTLLAQTTRNSIKEDWQNTLQQRLPVYGHRNWIIVSDSAFPAYSDSGIETIVVDRDLPTVLKYVTRAISATKHVRATAFLDRELQFVQEEDYPGVNKLRGEITNAFAKGSLTSIPHSEVLVKIDEAAKTFRILFIKTNATIPYTSVYIRLDCGYMSNEVEKKIGTAVAQDKR